MTVLTTSTFRSLTLLCTFLLWTGTSFPPQLVSTREIVLHNQSKISAPFLGSENITTKVSTSDFQINDDFRCAQQFDFMCTGDTRCCSTWLGQWYCCSNEFPCCASSFGDRYGCYQNHKCEYQD